MTTNDAGQQDQSPTPERLAFTTIDDIDLRGELSIPAEPTLVALLCHPHPLHGGNMNAHVIDRLFQTLPTHGVGCLRFNFRGVMGSEGMHGYGEDEQLDVAAGIAALKDVAPGVPILLAGWSFGADMCLTNTTEGVAGWFLIAPPLRTVSADAMGAITDPRPKLLVVPEHDQFNPPKIASATTESWAASKVTVVEGTDHFLAGKVDDIVDLAVSFAASLH